MRAKPQLQGLPPVFSDTNSRPSRLDGTRSRFSFTGHGAGCARGGRRWRRRCCAQPGRGLRAGRNRPGRGTANHRRAPGGSVALGSRRRRGSPVVGVFLASGLSVQRLAVLFAERGVAGPSCLPPGGVAEVAVPEAGQGRHLVDESAGEQAPRRHLAVPVDVREHDLVVLRGAGAPIEDLLRVRSSRISSWSPSTSMVSGSGAAGAGRGAGSTTGAAGAAGSSTTGRAAAASARALAAALPLPAVFAGHAWVVTVASILAEADGAAAWPRPVPFTTSQGRARAAAPLPRPATSPCPSRRPHRPGRRWARGRHGATTHASLGSAGWPSPLSGSDPSLRRRPHGACEPGRAPGSRRPGPSDRRPPPHG